MLRVNPRGIRPHPGWGTLGSGKNFQRPDDAVQTPRFRGRLRHGFHRNPEAGKFFRREEKAPASVA
jgi:hypothetical protein